MFQPLVDDRTQLFTALALPVAIVLGTVFLLALIKWAWSRSGIERSCRGAASGSAALRPLRPRTATSRDELVGDSTDLAPSPTRSGVQRRRRACCYADRRRRWRAQ